jgi:hypothetical protein
MENEIDKNTKITLDLKMAGMLVGFILTISSMYFVLKADIVVAKKLPLPVIQRVEYDLKDELIRQTILDTQLDVEILLKKVEKMDERIYKLSTKQ